jgi:hypothetical protein
MANSDYRAMVCAILPMARVSMPSICSIPGTLLLKTWVRSTLLRRLVVVLRRVS